MAFTADGLKFDHFMAWGQFVFVYTCKKKFVTENSFYD